MSTINNFKCIISVMINHLPVHNKVYKLHNDILCALNICVIPSRWKKNKVFGSNNYVPGFMYSYYRFCIQIYLFNLGVCFVKKLHLTRLFKIWVLYFGSLGPRSLITECMHAFLVICIHAYPFQIFVTISSFSL